MKILENIQLPRLPINKKLVIIIGLSLVAFGILVSVFNTTAEAGWIDTGWYFRKKLTIDSSKVSGTANFTNFPVVVQRTDSDLQAHAQSDGDDILFTNSDGTTHLDHEIESYDSTTGTLVAWVEIDTLDYNDDTVIYMYYGNPNASNQENATGTWNSDYDAVYHMQEDPSISTDGDCGGGTDEICDSTSNSNDANSAGGFVAADSVEGKTANAVEFDAASDDYLSLGTNYSWSPTASTVSVWFQYNSGPDVIFGDSTDTLVSTTINDSTTIAIAPGESSDSFTVPTMTSGEWYHLVITRSSNSTRVYLNGTESSTGSTTQSALANVNQIGRYHTNATYNYDGQLDNIRLMGTAVSSDRIATEYNNVSDPLAFFSQVSAPESLDDPAAHWKFDEGADNTCSGGEDACDSTNNGHHGTATNTTWKGEDLCLSGKCLLFDGTSSQVQIDDPIVTQYPFSMSAWIRTGTAGGSDTVISVGDISTNNSRFKIEVDSNGKAKLHARNTTVDEIVSNTSVNDNRWHYVSAVFASATDRKLYVDGRLENTDTSSVSFPSGADTVRIGNEVDNTPNEYYEGFIDEAKIYPTALSESLIKSNFVRGAGPRGSSAVFGAKDTSYLNDGLVGYWPMDETSGTTTTDSSGNGNTGTLTNMQESASGLDSSTTTTITDTDASLSSTDDAYNDMILFMSGGSCNVEDEQRVISDYVGSTNVITVSTAFSAAPDTTNCTYTIRHQVGGKFGHGLRFVGDTEDDFVTMGNQSEYIIGTDLTISAWVYKTATYERFTHVAGRWTHTSSLSYQLRFDYEKPGFNVTKTGYAATSSNVGSSNDINSDEWYHLTGIVRDMGNENTIEFYLNGELIETSSIDFDVHLGSAAFQVGQYGPNDNGNEFPGIIDDVRIYNRALSPAEVQDLYNWAPRPVAEYRLDENTGTSTTYDTSSNGIDGTLNGSVTEDDWVPGQYGSGLEFDGTNDYIDTTYSDTLDFGTNSFTVGSWMKIDSTGLSDIYRERVGASSDDAHERGNLSPSTTDTNHRMNNSSNSDFVYQTGMRYTNITIPQGATIDNAYISWTPTGTSTDDPDIEIFCEDVDDATTFSTTDDDIADRLATGTTTASTIWSTTNVGTSEVDTPDISGCVQEVIDRVGWSSGNALNVLTDGNTSSPTYNNIVVYSYNFDTGTAPRLTIEYTSSEDRHIINRYNNAGWKVYMEEDGDICFGIDDDSTWDTTDIACSSGTDYADNDWHYITAKKVENDGIYLYLNGELIASDESLVETGSLSGSSSPTLKIGSNSDGSSNIWSGTLDHLQVYNYARTPGQIIEDMNGGHPIGGSPIGSQVARWKFDEMYGTTANNEVSTQSSLTGSISGATWMNDCKVGSCLDYDGTDDVTTVTNANAIDFDNNLSSGFTFSTWINADSDGENNTGEIFDKGTGTYCRTDTQGTTDLDLECNLDLATTDANVNIADALTTDTWHHIAVTHDGSSTIEVFVDGISRGSDTGTGAKSADANNLLIGGDISNNFDGSIDDFKIYNTTLTSDQILIDMNANSSSALGGVLGTRERDTLTDGTMTDPVAYWNFDENMGTDINDYSGNGYDGTMTNSPLWTPGIHGSSLTFDSSSSTYVNVTDTTVFDTSEPFTVSTWIYPTADATQTYFSKDENLALYIDNDQAIHGCDDSGCIGSDTFTIDGVAPLNEWTHVVYIHDGSGNYTFYINGIDETSDGTGADSNTNDDIFIGVDDLTDEYYWDGQIDEVKVWDYELSQAQVAYEYNRGAPVGWWRFDECSGTTANDASGNGNDGTITASTGNSVGTCGGTAGDMWADGETGKYNASLDFDGTDDYVNTGLNKSFEQYSLSAWIYIDSFGESGKGRIIEKRETGSEVLVFYVADSQGGNNGLIFSQWFSGGQGSWRSSDNEIIQTNTWYHVAVTYDASDANNNPTMFVDGREIPVTEYNTPSGNYSINADDYIIGNRTLDTNRSFDGQIDDVRIYNYALSEQQIRNIMNYGAVRFSP